MQMWTRVWPHLQTSERRSLPSLPNWLEDLICRLMVRSDRTRRKNVRELHHLYIILLLLLFPKQPEHCQAWASDQLHAWRVCICVFTFSGVSQLNSVLITNSSILSSSPLSLSWKANNISPLAPFSCSQHSTTLVQQRSPQRTATGVKRNQLF